MGSLGEQLRQVREDAGLTLDDLAQKTKIQVKYLERLENEEFDKLPKLVYVRGFIQKWASVCNCDQEALLLQFHRENQTMINSAQNGNSLSSVSSPSFIITSKHIIGLIVLIGTSSLLGYFYYNQRILSQAPRVEVMSPEEFSSASEEDVILIQGETENITSLYINGTEAPVGSDGIFEYPYKLQAGLNNISIKAKTSNGEEVETIRKILKLGDEGVQEIEVEDRNEE